MTKHDQIVHIIDDDEAVLTSLAWVFDAAELKFITHQKPDTFFDTLRPNEAGCLLLDLQMPGRTGIDVLKELKARPDFHMPVIIVSGTASVTTAVMAMKLGTVDVLQKPVNPKLLIERVLEAFKASERKSVEVAETGGVRERMASLSDREIEVVDLLCTGHSTKQIALKLGISIKTVANHRYNINHKMKVENTAHLVQVVMTLRMPRRTDDSLSPAIAPRDADVART